MVLTRKEESKEFLHIINQNKRYNLFEFIRTLTRQHVPMCCTSSPIDSRSHSSNVTSLLHNSIRRSTLFSLLASILDEIQRENSAVKRSDQLNVLVCSLLLKLPSFLLSFLVSSLSIPIFHLFSFILVSLSERLVITTAVFFISSNKFRTPKQNFMKHVMKVVPWEVSPMP